MFEEFYGLQADPFRLSPDHAFCLRHPSFAKARAYMQFAVQRAEGFVMITGRPGTGKTTLIEDLLEQIGGREVVAAKLVSAQLEADDLLRMVAFNFGIGAQGREKSSLLMEMQGFLADRIASGQRPLLVIDEAQGLSLKAIEELRLLTNLRLNGQPMLQIFLVGQEELRDLVLDPRMEQLHQRLIASCHLEPLSLEETAAYVMHRLKVAGWRGRPRLRPRLFPVLHRFSRGIPRRINLFMGRLLMHGWLEEKAELTLEDARVVLGELKSEHLVPMRADAPLMPDEADIELENEEHLEALVAAPDQKIGEKLLERGGLDLRFRGSPGATGIRAYPRAGADVARERLPDATAAAAEGATETALILPLPLTAADAAPSREPHPGVEPARPGAILPEGPVNRLLEEESVPVVPVSAPPRAPAATPPIPRRRRGLFWGLGLSLSTAALVFATAATTVPLGAADGGALDLLLRASGIADLRRHLHRWSGGQIPFLMSPARKDGRREPEQGSVALPDIRGRADSTG